MTRMSHLTLDDVAAIAAELPQVTEETRRDARSWAVAGRTFAWERPYTKADLRRFGSERVPEQPVVAIRVDDLGERDAVLERRHRGFFTMEHFAGYPAVLVQVSRAARGPLREALVDGWLTLAPPSLAEEFLAR